MICDTPSHLDFGKENCPECAVYLCRECKTNEVCEEAEELNLDLCLPCLDEHLEDREIEWALESLQMEE